MTVKTCFSSTIDYTSGGKFQTFKNLNNLKKKTDYAESNVIHGKSKPLNRPSTLTFSNFKAGIPTGALITKVTVKYKHVKVKQDNKDCNVQAPTITLMNGDNPLKYKKTKVQNVNVSNSSLQYVDPTVYKTNTVTKKMVKKGKAPTSKATEQSVSFSSTFDLTVINSKDFKVKFDYPTNANENDGIIRLYYVSVTIEYKESKYSLFMSKLTGTYNGDEYEIKLTVSNKNLTKYSPNIVITAPLGFSLKDYRTGNTSDVLTVNNARTFTYTPKFSTKTGEATLRLVLETNITYANDVESVSRQFTAIEQLTSAKSTLNVTVNKTRPLNTRVDSAPTTNYEFITDEKGDLNNPEVVSITKNLLKFDMDFGLPEDTQLLIRAIPISNGDYSTWMDNLNNPARILRSWIEGAYSFQAFTQLSATVKNLTSEHDGGYYQEVDNGGVKYFEYVEPSNPYGIAIIDYGQFALVIMDTSEQILKVIFIDKFGGTPDVPCSILELTSEETDRLGHEITYIAETEMSFQSTEKYIRDAGNSCRIGIFNNAISENITITETVDDETGETIETVTDSTDYANLTLQEIYNNAEYWSPMLSKLQEFEELTVEFPYNENYPVYIIVTGDAKHANVSFKEPCIVENGYWKNREPSGTYPVPINDIILSDGSTGELNLPALSNSSSLIFYDFPLGENYGTNDEIAIRGLELRGTIESNTDNIVLQASLRNNQNQSFERSITLDELQSDENGTEFSIGGVGDLWGFSTFDIVDLEDWEAIITASNSLLNDLGSVNFGNIRLIVYVEPIEEQINRCIIDGEDLIYYGVFLNNVTIPEGVKTDTDYLNVKGTDLNVPYSQTIKEKTIELEFDIGDNCDLIGSTASLQLLARLLTNERDQYNNPIPKQIEFSHYPNIVWEYILESGFDNEIEISSYTVKVKLTVPSGTGVSKYMKMTNASGFASGITHVKPVVRVKPESGSDMISVQETLTGQEFNIAYGDWEEKYVEIDCDNRIVLLKEDDDDETGIDISAYADINCDWFRIFGEYQFGCMNGAIQAIEYRERW